MERKEILKSGRDSLLKLHKSLLDHERAIYEGINGPVNAGQFLNILLESEDFAWLRKFSTLIVEIDEMFDQKDGVTDEAVKLHIEKVRDLISMKDEDEGFKAKYQSALQLDLDAAAHQGTLKELLKT
ncbi:MAG: hypothetical protein DMF62_10125 [Acidobacteria bacterium]|nr:MAG: hypothetical protein DMF62_10125 [Acidobacteriota bacterium]